MDRNGKKKKIGSGRSGNRASRVTQESKESTCQPGDRGSIPRSGRSSVKGNGSPLQSYSWEIPQTEGPGRLESRLEGCQELDKI